MSRATNRQHPGTRHCLLLNQPVYAKLTEVLAAAAFTDLIKNRIALSEFGWQSVLNPFRTDFDAPNT